MSACGEISYIPLRAVSKSLLSLLVTYLLSHIAYIILGIVNVSRGFN